MDVIGMTEDVVDEKYWILGFLGFMCFMGVLLFPNMIRGCFFYFATLDYLDFFATNIRARQ